MSIPLFLEAGPLSPDDLRRFAPLFAAAAFDFFPCETALPVPWSDRDDEAAGEFVPELAQIRQSRLPMVSAEKQELFLPVWGGETLCGILALKGGDPGLYTMPEAWLDEQSHLISREFFLLKQSCHDPVTGLLNGFHLRRELESQGQGGETPGPAILVLLEICPRNRDAERSIRYIARASGCLASMLGEGAGLHHLGAGIFAFLWQDVDMEQARHLGETLLLRLRRENFLAAHLGLAALDSSGLRKRSSGSRQVLDEAWQAMAAARKRGPFSLYGHITSQELDSHPFRKIPEAAARKLRSLYLGKALFSLALLRMDQEPVSNHFSKRLKTLLGQDRGLILLSQREAFVFLDGMDLKAARLWLDEFRGKMEALGGSSFSGGLASFPFGDYKKSALAMNCRKALEHAAFFGPGSLAVFDAVSLNISGDIYYNQGDLVRAMAEYRQGLLLDPANVNILNSLGVASIQLNRLRAARDCFVKALAVEPGNFMALFNLGFICLENRQITDALALWEKALDRDDEQTALLQQLGVLYYRQGRYTEARKLLEHCAALLGRDPQQGGEPLVVARWLGRACEALGDNSAAIAAYQKALSGNSRDAGSLSRLGCLYAVEKQGLEIALSMCGKAVELDRGKAGNWLRLGRVQLMAMDDQEAGRSLRECLRLDPRQREAGLLLGEIFIRQGRPARARKLYRNILRYFPQHAGANEALAAIS